MKHLIERSGIVFMDIPVKPRYDMLSRIVSIVIAILYLTSVILWAGLCLFGGYEQQLWLCLSVGCVIGFGYLMYLSPWCQSDGQYQMNQIDFLHNYIFWYKGRQVVVDCSYDAYTRCLSFHKSSAVTCIQYVDNNTMFDFTRYKLLNYLLKWCDTQNISIKYLDN